MKAKNPDTENRWAAERLGGNLPNRDDTQRQEKGLGLGENQYHAALSLLIDGKGGVVYHTLLQGTVQ